MILVQQKDLRQRPKRASPSHPFAVGLRLRLDADIQQRALGVRALHPARLAAEGHPEPLHALLVRLLLVDEHERLRGKRPDVLRTAVGFGEALADGLVAQGLGGLALDAPHQLLALVRHLPPAHRPRSESDKHRQRGMDGVSRS